MRTATIYLGRPRNASDAAQRQEQDMNERRNTPETWPILAAAVKAACPSLGVRVCPPEYEGHEGGGIEISVMIARTGTVGCARMREMDGLSRMTVEELVAWASQTAREWTRRSRTNSARIAHLRSMDR